jgi:hypothetical protein
MTKPDITASSTNCMLGWRELACIGIFYLFYSVDKIDTEEIVLLLKEPITVDGNNLKIKSKN